MIVEDGTGLDDANSYATVEEADAYFDERSNAAWAAIATDAAKEALLVRATDYVEQRWALLFSGARAVAGQALSWPRTDAVDRLADTVADDVVPVGVKAAVYEYALRANTAELAPDPSATSTAAVKRVKKKVGPIETETEYADGGVAYRAFTPYPAADALLKRYLRGGGNTVSR